MSLSYFLDCLKLVRLVVVPNFRASTGGYYNLIIITRSSHFTWNVGPLWPFFSLELYTLFSIVQCRVPGVLLHGLLTCRIRAVCDGMVWYVGMGGVTIFLVRRSNRWKCRWGDWNFITLLMRQEQENWRKEGFGKNLCNKDGWNKLFDRICGLIWIFIKMKRVRSLSNID